MTLRTIDLDALDSAMQSFSQVLGSLGTEVLERPSACGDWTVKDVANHVCGGALRYAHYLRGGMLRMRVIELAVHAWDITSSLDRTSTINNDVAAYILDRATAILQAQRERGYFADVGPANPDTPAPARLLALTGRSMP